MVVLLNIVFLQEFLGQGFQYKLSNFFHLPPILQLLFGHKYVDLPTKGSKQRM